MYKKCRIFDSLNLILNNDSKTKYKIIVKFDLYPLEIKLL